MNYTSAGISMNGHKLEKVTSFMYLGATQCKGGTFSAEILIRITSANGSDCKIKQDLAKRHQQLRNLYTVSLLSPPSSSMAVRHSTSFLTLRFRSRLSRLSASGSFSASPAWSTRLTTGC